MFNRNNENLRRRERGFACQDANQFNMIWAVLEYFESNTCKESDTVVFVDALAVLQTSFVLPVWPHGTEKVATNFFLFFLYVRCQRFRFKIETLWLGFTCEASTVHQACLNVDHRLPFCTLPRGS